VRPRPNILTMGAFVHTSPNASNQSDNQWLGQGGGTHREEDAREEDAASVYSYG